MSPRLRIYVVLVGVLALGVTVAFTPADLDRRWLHYVLWTLITLGCESLWLTPVSGQGVMSVASTANLATLMLWGPGPAIWITAASTLAGARFLQKRPWVRALFNAAQIALTMAAAGLVMGWLGAPPRGLQAVGAAALDHGIAPLVASFFGLVVVYVVVNRVLVSIAVAWSTDRRIVRVLREDWFYREQLLDDLGVLIMSPIMAVCFLAIGYVGVLLFFAPLRICHESQKRYADLRDAQKTMILMERAEAKGKIARELGHELRGRIAPVSGRAQMLIREAERGVFTNVARHAQIIIDTANRMTSMAEAIMQARDEALKLETVDLNGLIQRTIEFVRVQDKFDGVAWDLRFGDKLPELRGDRELLQECLINLFVNAAEAMLEHQVEARRITVTTEPDTNPGRLRLLVRDSGPGVPPQLRERIFNPMMTTKKTGNGFGLAKTFRVISAHGGEIVVADTPAGEGAVFVVTLPVQGPPTPAVAAAA